MIEKVARAIWNTYPQATTREPWDEADPDIVDQVMAEAKEAIKAMRNPNHEMTGAIIRPGDSRAQAVKSWNKMIDAALEGK